MTTATRPAYNPAGLPPAVADMAVAAAARQQARGGLLFPPARVGGAL